MIMMLIQTNEGSVGDFRKKNNSQFKEYFTENFQPFDFSLLIES